MVLRDIQLTDKPFLAPYFNIWSVGNSEFSFANLYLWRKPWTTRWAIEQDVLFITMQHRQQGSKVVLFPPLPLDPARDYNEVLALARAFFQEIGQPFQLRSASGKILQHIRTQCPDRFDYHYERDISEYVYRVEDLMFLAGKKYHRKRNHITRFTKLYPDAEFSLLTEADVCECKQLYELWLDNKEENHKLMTDERDAVYAALDHLQELDLVGCAIRIDGRICAFSIGEQVTPDTTIIHIEKAEREIEGLYPYINRTFLQNVWSASTYVNREEDLGIPGLRKAKESYYPVHLIDKFTISEKA